MINCAMHGIFPQLWFDLEPFLDINSLAARKHDIACALAAFFGSADLHGSDPNIYPSYSIRIDGVFAEEFLARTGLKGWKQA